MLVLRNVQMFLLCNIAASVVSAKHSWHRIAIVAVITVKYHSYVMLCYPHAFCCASLVLADIVYFVKSLTQHSTYKKTVPVNYFRKCEAR